MPKKGNGVSDYEYKRVMAETDWQWDERVCTKNQKVYEQRKTGIKSGHTVQICNNVADFDFSTVNYDWYINEARKLVIG